MRHLLLLLLLLFSPLVGAQEHSHAHDVVLEPALVPTPQPAIVAGALTTPRFRILYTAASKGSAEALARDIEGVRDSFAAVLGRDWPGVTEIRIGVGRQEFEKLALPGGEPPPWAVALAYPSHSIVLLNALTLLGPEGPVTLRHELSHVALGQLGQGWPRWFQEGLAQHLTGERYSMTHYSALFTAVTQNKIFSFELLADGWPHLPSDVEIAYAQSAAFVAWLAQRHGPEGMGRLVDEVRKGQHFETAFAKALHTSVTVEEKDWREGLAARYGWLPLTTSMSLVWLGATALVVAAYVRRRKQKAEKLTEMEAQDEAEEAALRAALLAEAALQQPPGLPPEEEPVTSPGTAVPEWYEPPAARAEAEGEEDEEHPPRPHKPTLH
jgi:hypothetical protein